MKTNKISPQLLFMAFGIVQITLIIFIVLGSVILIANNMFLIDTYSERIGINKNLIIIVPLLLSTLLIIGVILFLRKTKVGFYFSVLFITFLFTANLVAILLQGIYSYPFEKYIYFWLQLILFSIVLTVTICTATSRKLRYIFGITMSRFIIKILLPVIGLAIFSGVGIYYTAGGY